MEFMRNAAKTWIAKLLMALLVVSFGVWGIRDVSSSFIGDMLSWTGWGPKDLVHVAGRTIRQPEYNVALQRTLQTLSAQSGQRLTIDDAKRMGVDRSVLNNLIDSASVDATAAKLKLAVSDQSILQSVADNKMFQDATGRFDASFFSRLLEQNNVSEADYLASEKTGRLRNFVTAVANGSTKLPKTLNAALAQYRGETRDVKYFDFTVAEADVPAATADELQKQYEATPAAYTAPEYRSIAIMKVEPADISNRISVSAEELQTGYDQFKADYFKPEKRTVLQLTFPTLDAAKKAKDRLSAGEDFMKLATEMKLKDSDVTLTDRQRSDFLDPKIADAAFKLSADAISDPVQGDLAIAVLKILKISAEKQSTLEEVKDVLTKRLQLEKAKEEITATYNEVEDARSQQTPFEKIAERANIAFQFIPAISATGQDKAGKDITLAGKEQVLKAGFLTDVGNSDDALPLGDGYVWYEVREIVPPGLRPLADIKDAVSKDLMAAKIRDFASTKAKSYLADAKAGATLDAMAVKAAATVKSATGMKRNETSQEFDYAAVAALYNVGDQAYTWSLAGDGKTARIMQISKVTLPAVMASSPEITKLQEDVKTGMAQDIGQSFVASLRKAANVRINEELWKQNSGTDFE